MTHEQDKDPLSAARGILIWTTVMIGFYAIAWFAVHGA